MFYRRWEVENLLPVGHCILPIACRSLKALGEKINLMISAEKHVSPPTPIQYGTPELRYHKAIVAARKGNAKQ